LSSLRSIFYFNEDSGSVCALSVVALVSFFFSGYGFGITANAGFEEGAVGFGKAF